MLNFVLGENFKIGAYDYTFANAEAEKTAMEKLKKFADVFCTCYDKVEEFLKKYEVWGLNKHNLKPVFYLQYRNNPNKCDGQYFESSNHLVVYESYLINEKIIDCLDNIELLQTTIIHELFHMMFTSAQVDFDGKNNYFLKTVKCGLCAPISDNKIKENKEYSHFLHFLDETLICCATIECFGKEILGMVPEKYKKAVKIIREKLMTTEILKALAFHDPMVVLNKIPTETVRFWSELKTRLEANQSESKQSELNKM